MADAPMPPDAEESESISAPISALGGAKVGDTVTFTVDSIDGETASLSPADAGGEDEGEAQAGSAISEASKLFKEGD